MTTRGAIAHGPDPGRGGLPRQDPLPEKGSNGNATVTDPNSVACGHLLEKYDGGATTFNLRGLDSALRREVELEAGAYEWVKDYIYRDGLLLASQHRTEGHQHYRLDHLGTTRMLTNRCGERVKRYELFPYGADTVSAPANDTETHRFTGHQRDLGSPTNTTDDLEYMHARYYGVKMGRLLSVDPGGGRARTPMQWNRYAYVSGNPMRRVDPDGAEEAEVAISIWQRETIRDYYNQAEPGLGDVLAEQHDRSMRAGAAGALAVFGAAAAVVFAPEIYTWFLTPRGQQTVANTIEALNPNPGGSSVGTDFSRSLSAADLGIRGAIQELKGTISMSSGHMSITVDMISGTVTNPMQVMNTIIANAKKAGATSLEIRGTLANVRLLEILKKRYRAVTEGGSEAIFIVFEHT